MGNRVRSIVGHRERHHQLHPHAHDARTSSPSPRPWPRRRQKGFAEADPTLDVSGGDAAQKIGLLASLAFGCWIEPADILCEGIARCDAEGHRVLPGQRVRRSSWSRRRGWSRARPLVTVFPALVPLDHPLAGVRDEFNGVLVDSDFLGPSVYEGRGAGGNPTASSVASDLGDLLKTILSQQVPRPVRGELALRAAVPVGADARAGTTSISSRPTGPGIWALVTGICAENGINIESVHQKWEDKTKPSDLYVLVDEAEEAQVRAAFARIIGLGRHLSRVALFQGPGEARGRATMIDLHTHTFLSDGDAGPRGAGAPRRARRLPRHRHHRSRGCLEPGRPDLRASCSSCGRRSRS